MNITKCDHVFAGDSKTKCGEDIGHDGLHVCYRHAEEGSFVVLEWNSEGETRPRRLGQSFEVDYASGTDEKQKTMDKAIRAAKKQLPKGKVFEIRAKMLPYEGCIRYGETIMTLREMEKDWGIGWFCFDKTVKGFEDIEIEQEPLFCNDVDDHIISALGGYLLLARIKA